MADGISLICADGVTDGLRDGVADGISLIWADCCAETDGRVEGAGDCADGCAEANGCSDGGPKRRRGSIAFAMRSPLIRNEVAS